MLGVNAVVGALSLSAFNLEVRTNRFKLGKQEEERERERERVVVTRLWRPKLVQEEQVSSWTQPLGIRIDLYIRSPDWREYLE